MTQIAKSKNRFILIIAIAVVIIFALFAFIIWKAGFLTFTGDEPSAKVIAASIALLGGLFGSLITLIGLLLKHSIDLRSIAIEESSELRAKEAERRLKIEAAIQSLDLLSTSDGKEVPEIQKAGVILTLGNLKMFGIALSLAEQMVKNNSLDSVTFCWLLDKVITSGSDVVKNQAVLTLGDHVDRMLRSNGIAFFPSTLIDAKNVISLPENIRSNTVDAIIDLITLRPFPDWKRDHLTTFLATLYEIGKSEEVDYLKVDIGIALLHFLKVYPQDISYIFMDKERTIGELSKEFSGYANFKIQTTATTNGLPRMDNVLAWAAQKKIP